MAEPLSPMSRLLHHRMQRLAKGDPLALPITASSTFYLPGDPDGAHFYGRNGNPTVEQVEEEIGILEGGEAVLFPSGMAAIASVFYGYLRPGDTVLVHSDGYYNVRALLETQFAPMGVHVITCPTTDMMTADKTGCRLVMIETPSNPGLAVCDIAVIAARAKAAGALLVADNTTATAICQQPLDLGADLVVMSDTKAMGGHSDILAGHVAARGTSLLEPVKTWRRLAGAIVSPFDAYLLHRGMATLDVRLSRANANALAAAEALRAHPAVISVNYPGLTNDPSHEIASRQMQGFGPVVSFTLANRNAAENFIENSDMITAATSFGGVHTTAECRVRWGDAVPEGFVRLSCGIEPTADLVTSLTRALDSLA